MGLTALQTLSELKATPRSGEWCEIGHTAPGKLLSRCTSNCVLRYTSPSNHVSEQNSYRWGPAASRADNDLGDGAVRK